MTLRKLLSLIALVLLLPVIGIATDGTAATQPPVTPSAVETTWKQYLPAVDSCSYVKYKQSHPQSFRVASACTVACQKKHDACYADCNVRFPGDTDTTAGCKGACDGDKRLCRAACRR